MLPLPGGVAAMHSRQNGGGGVDNDPDNADFYKANRDDFIDRVDRAMFGDELVDMFDGETLSGLLANNT
ncbi:MAG: hypothetical protein R6V38_06340, partial [Roseovarius gahaiensis]